MKQVSITVNGKEYQRLIPEEMLVKEAAEHRMPKAKQLSLFE